MQSNGADAGNLKALQCAVERYFDLLHTCDVGNFSKVFHESAQLHGYRDGQLVIWPASHYREVLAQRAAPGGFGAARSGTILTIDFASDSQALVKVMITIGRSRFTDHLIFLKIDGEWLIVSKVFHVANA